MTKSGATAQIHPEVISFVEALKVEVRETGLALARLQLRASRLRVGSLTPATVSRMCNGNLGALRNWENVQRLLRTLEVPEAAIEGKWKPWWKKISEHLVPQRTFDIQPPPTDGGTECEECGAWVVNQERHEAWHWRVRREAAQQNQLQQDPGKVIRLTS